jgi:diguanylate cyclase (GGDEF)-like protein
MCMSVSKMQILKFLEDVLEENQYVICVIADIDYFVNIASKVGDAEADRILQRIGTFLANNLSGFVGTYGNDEYIIIYDRFNQDEVCDDLNSVRKKIRKERFISQGSIYHNVRISLSFGLACSRKNETLYHLLKRTEIALCMAKKKGRHRVEIALDSNLQWSYNKEEFLYTLAGPALKGYAGDGGLVINASLCEPYGICISDMGELYIADRGNHVIRRINKDETIVTIAGCGAYGYAGDGDLAIRAKLNKPSGVAVDLLGNLYIADTGNHCIRKVDVSGIISTYAGTGREGNTRYKESATNYCLSRPGGVVVDDRGNLYTNDYGNNRIVQIGDGYAKELNIIGNCKNRDLIDKPYGLAVTRNGQWLYIANLGHNNILRYDLKGDVTTIINITIGGAKIEPYWIDIYGERYLFVADAANSCIIVYDIFMNKIIYIIGGPDPGYRDAKNRDGEIKFNIPAGIAVEQSLNKAYIVDYANNAIRALNLELIS